MESVKSGVSELWKTCNTIIIVGIRAISHGYNYKIYTFELEL